MGEEKESYIYGPVHSRRLGYSLGVDMVPLKVCDYDCIYCQLGRTTKKTSERRPYIPADGILEQLEKRLAEEPGTDFITLAGSGEPTLNSELSKVIEGIRSISDLPLAVLTNGSLLGDPAVSGPCLAADLVMPSLDAGDEEVFQKVNRPVRGMTLEEVVEGLVSFRKIFDKEIWLEVFLLDGINSDREHAGKMKRLIDRIRPQRVQINTVVRPQAEPYAKGVKARELERVRPLLGKEAELIPDIADGKAKPGKGWGREEILSLLRRRPSTVEQIARSLGTHPALVVKITGYLVDEGILKTRVVGGKRYFLPA